MYQNRLYLLNIYKHTTKISLFIVFSLFLDQGTIRYSDLYSNVLEIYYNGGWSYICPYGWDDTDSTVACRQLGYTSSFYYGHYFYRTSIAASFLNNFQVSCNGTESSLIYCEYNNDTCPYSSYYSSSTYSYYYTRYLRLYCTGGNNSIDSSML